MYRTNSNLFCRYFQLLVWLCVVLFGLGACGGGGGSGSNNTATTYTLGGAISGLISSGLVLANGTDTVTVLANAANFTMPTSLTAGTAYSVSVQTQPAGLTCSTSSSSGTMPIGNVINVTVTCSDKSYTLGGTITGLTSNGFVLANGTDTVTVPANATTFMLPTPVAYTSNYMVTVQTQPTGLTCSVSNGTGTMPAAVVSSVTVTCATTSYNLGGSITGLTTDGLKLTNGADTLLVSANATSFTMPTTVAYGSGYGVTVSLNPFGLTCAVTNGTGNMPSGNVTSVQVSCAPRAVVESVLWSFSGSPDGALPQGALIRGSDGNYYGTTQNGGTNNSGSVIKMTPAGVVTILYSLYSVTDGAFPQAALVQGSDGDFYGSTTGGGNGNCGYVFKITPTGTYTVLHAWAGNTSDGCKVAGPLIQGSDGNFYGTTSVGGTVGAGTVFKITPTGTETMLHSFAGGADGITPNRGGLIEGNDGNFYGMTSAGGTASYGTVFQITPMGTESVLYTFSGNGGTDGGRPASGLVKASNGNFYGTSTGVSSGGGTLFEISPTGTRTTIYSFPLNGPNTPVGLLIAPDGNFYGMSSGGGTYNQGAAWKVTPSGVETTLYSLKGGTSDGSLPLAGLVIGLDGSDYNLYGTADLAGAHNFGTVFKITP